MRLSTPQTAYEYLLEIGVPPPTASRIVAMGRGVFEYFLKAINA